MPVTKLQSHVLRVLAAERNPDFQDTEQRLEAAAQADATALIDAGLKFSPSSPEISSAMLERYKKQNGNGNEPKP